MKTNHRRGTKDTRHLPSERRRTGIEMGTGDHDNGARGLAKEIKFAKTLARRDERRKADEKLRKQITRLEVFGG